VVSQILRRHDAHPLVGTQIPEGGPSIVTSISLPGRSAVPRVHVSPEALTKGRVILLLSVTMFLAVAVYYFVGIDEGMTSVFGKTMVIHEWVHDSRHFLGFPCH
jgi:hypothetical protein